MLTARELKFKEWSDDVAQLAVDALLYAGLFDEDDFKDACYIVGEEIFVRLILGDLHDSTNLLESGNGQGEE